MANSLNPLILAMIWPEFKAYVYIYLQWYIAQELCEYETWVEKYKQHSLRKFFFNLKAHCNPVQGQYRARTGFSLWSFPHREKPVFITGNPYSHCRDPCFHYREWVCSALHIAEGADRKKQTQKKIFTDFVRSCVISMKSLTINTIMF